MLSKVNRLKGKANFNKIFKRGEKFYSPYFVAYRLSLPTTPESIQQPRFGIVTSKKVGGAVVRNRARRLISTIIRTELTKFPSNSNFVFVAFDRIAEADLDQVNQAFTAIMPKLTK